ncbi:MAG TPA: STN domain-containing protein, partial [Dyella sp.]
MTVRAQLLFYGSLAMAMNLLAPGAVMAAARSAPAETRMDFVIPAQSLAAALIAFGKQANVQVLTAGGAIAGFRSPGLSGSFSAEAALSRLLQGTGLNYEFTDAGTVVVRPPAIA